MNPSTPRDEDLLLINAYIDGELDAAGVLDIERRMSVDAALKFEYDRLVDLRALLAASIPKDQASEALRQKIISAAAPQSLTRPGVSTSRFRSRTFDWRQMAASIFVASILASGATSLALRSGHLDDDVAAVASGHQRALLAASSVDVASSDRHTVKPWFDSKLAISPPVIDLASSGFPLAGGRVEVVGGKPTPALVYKRREHLISLVAIPRPGGADNNTPVARFSRDGYTVLSWSGQDFAYLAVSDIAHDDLAAFVSQWRAETRQK